MHRYLGFHHTKLRFRIVQIIRFLYRTLAQTPPSIHYRRLTMLMSCVRSLLHGRRLTLTVFGRFMPSQAYPRTIDLYCVRHSAKGRKPQRVTGSIAKSKLRR